MATTVLNAYSTAYPAITNRIQASVFLQSSPAALVASQIDSTAGHPQRVWSFPGLPRNNYGFKLDEIDGSGNPINNLCYFDVVPGESDTVSIREDEQITVDVTVGLVSETNTFTFDGTGGKPDYRNWDIVPSELTGRGILIKDVYTWDKTTGTFTFTQAGDTFATQVVYNIHFEPIVTSGNNSYPTINDFTTRLITATGNILISDFGENILVEPASDYIELTLPDANTVVEGRPLMVEIGGVGTATVKFLTTLGQSINFLRGKLFALTGETFIIYCYSREGVKEFRLKNVSGNFSKVGDIVYSDMIQGNLFNYQKLDGSLLYDNQRLYQEVVLNLPLDQVVAYTDWGANPTKYSYSSGGQFHVPDRRGFFTRNTGTDVAGTMKPAQVGEFNGVVTIPKAGTSQTATGSGKIAGGGASQEPNDMNILMSFNTGLENMPINFSANQYVVL